MVRFPIPCWRDANGELVVSSPFALSHEHTEAAIRDLAKFRGELFGVVWPIAAGQSSDVESHKQAFSRNRRMPTDVPCLATVERRGRHHEIAYLPLNSACNRNPGTRSITHAP